MQSIDIAGKSCQKLHGFGSLGGIIVKVHVIEEEVNKMTRVLFLET